MQTRALHSLAIIPRNLHGVPHSIQFRVDLNTLTRSRSIHNRDKHSLRNAAQPLARCGYIYVTRTQPHGAPSKRTFATLPLRPVLLYIITLRCFSVAFSALSISFRPILRQTELIVQLNIPQRLSFARTPRQTRSLAVLTRFIAPLRGGIPPPRAFRVLFARLPPSPRQLLPSNCRSTLRPDSFGSLYSRKRCRGAHFFVFSFHVEHTSCHSPKPQRLSRFLLVYAYLYIASLHVFRLCVCFFRPCDPFPVAAPRLTIAPRRRSAAFVSEPLIAARLAVFVGARLHSVFPRSYSLFFDFSISFCLMLYGAPQTFCLFFSAFGFSRFPFEDPLRIFLRI